MARAGKESLLHGLKGSIGKELVVKQYKDKMVVSKYPDMSKVKPSALQKKNRSKMKEAIAYAQGILYDAKKKAAYQKRIRKDKSVYREAIKEYLKKRK